MATYTPKTLAAHAALSATTATIYTATAVTGIVRTIHIQAPSAARTFTMSQGADAAGTRWFDAYALTSNVPFIVNGWYGITASGIVAANGSTTAVTGSLHGYEYA